MRIALVFLTAAIMGTYCAEAQDKRAKTEDGKEVILRTDGTWTYVGEYKKDKKAALAYTGKRGTFAFHLLPDTWKKLDKVENADAEVGFAHKDGEAFALVMAERIQVPLATLKKIAVENWRSVDKNAKVVLDEKRTVNGKEVLCLAAEVESEGVAFTFFGYYYSSEAGTVQVLTWTGRNLFKEFKPELEAFLNGFEIIEKKK